MIASSIVFRIEKYQNPDSNANFCKSDKDKDDFINDAYAEEKGQILTQESQPKQSFRRSSAAVSPANRAMTANGPGVAGVDGMIEADVVAKDVLNAIEEERFLVTPHDEVLEYVKRKGNDRDRWIAGMQRLQVQYEDFLTPMEDK